MTAFCINFWALVTNYTIIVNYVQLQYMPWLGSFASVSLQFKVYWCAKSGERAVGGTAQRALHSEIYSSTTVSKPDYIPI